MWLVPAILMQEAIKGKGKGKGAGDKGSKGNTGSQGDKGSMGGKGSKGARLARAVAAPNAHHNLLRLPSLCGSLARCTSP
jgi:hypothetical protein